MEGRDLTQHQDSGCTTYTVEEHRSWNKLYHYQIDLIRDVTCHLYTQGFERLALDPFHVPDQRCVSEHLSQLTGWTVTNAQNKFLNTDEWFDHLLHYRFPATNYIRNESELDFCALPDLFHEYFGHLPFMTDPSFADIIHRYGVVYNLARTKAQRLAISRLFWFSIEFGFIWEEGEEKVLGAALYSSRGEMGHALNPSTPHYPFDINRVAITEAYPSAYHGQYFVIDSIEQVRAIIDDYAQQEGLEG